MAGKDAGGPMVPKDEVIRLLTELVQPLSVALPQPSEVVLHDLDRLPNSIVAIAGSLTGRDVGGAATDMLLRRAARDTLETLSGYETKAPDGRTLRSTTMVVRDSEGEPVAALCINTDTTPWETMKATIDSLLGTRPVATAVPQPEHEPETFVTDLDDLSSQMLAEAIATVPVPVGLMRKQHKLAVVQELRGKGFFLLKESVETAAKALGVTRFTIYNYINELAAAEAAREPADAS